MDNNDPSSPAGRRRAEALVDRVWPALAPPEGFADRVVSALHGGGAAVPVARARRLPWAALGACVGAAAAAAMLALAPGREAPSRGGSAAGSVVTAARETVHIGDRAIAVAEAGAELAWSQRGGRMRVDQPRGRVFYRVDHGGPFLVVTPAGDVRVTGTCFRVTIEGGGVGGEAGALTATAALVEVLEGGVVVANDAGEVAVPAGQRARAVLGEAPARLDGEGGGGPGDLAGGLAAGGATGGLERLLAAEARVRELERALEAARGGAAPSPPGTPARNKYYDFTPDELKALGRRCELRWVLPIHLTKWDGPHLDEKLALTEAERGAILRVMEEQRNQFMEDLRSIYLEVVGDRAAAATLSPMSLHAEIASKSRPGDNAEARRRILQEWSAGSPAPVGAPGLSAVDRFWRTLAAVEDAFFLKVAEIVGPDRAREVVRKTADFFVSETEKSCTPARVAEAKTR
jgi:hypothetical protein